MGTPDARSQNRLRMIFVLHFIVALYRVRETRYQTRQEYCTSISRRTQIDVALTLSSKNSQEVRVAANPCYGERHSEIANKKLIGFDGSRKL